MDVSANTGFEKYLSSGAIDNVQALVQRVLPPPEPYERMAKVSRWEKIVAGCPCDPCEKFSTCRRECKTFKQWAKQGARKSN